MAPPSFADINKSASSLVNKDFYHLSKASVDVKVQASAVGITLKGNTGKNNVLNSSIETKYSDKATGLVLTQGWNTSKSLNTKISLPNVLSPGLQTDIAASVVAQEVKSVKVNTSFSHDLVNVKNSFDAKSPLVSGSVTGGYKGLVAGVDYGVDLSKFIVGKYQAGLGYVTPFYSVSALANKNFSVFSYSLYQKISPATEIGAVAVYDSKNVTSKNPVGIEFAAKYSFDKSCFVKGKLSDSGLAAVSYKQNVAKGVSMGVGFSIDGMRLSEPVHKVGMSLSFTL